MPAGTSAGMAAIAASQAAIAAQQAHEVEVSRCKIIIDNFDSKKATIGQAQDYAHCINVVYPQPAIGTEILAFKIIFGIALIGMISNIIIQKIKNSYLCESFMDYLMLGLLGFIGLPCIVGIIGGICYGIYWLFA